MEAKWPFILITVTLIFGLGLTIAGLERSSVMKNWTDRRCELPVMATAMFFKPDSDPRSKTDYAKENFEFCMKSYIEKFMSILLAPIHVLFGKQVDIMSGAADSVNTVRSIAQKLYTTLSGFLDQYYRRFNAGIYEISKTVQYLRMIMGRINASVMGMLYSGISLYRGMLNTVQFVIKVILIVCGIMIALIIILIFILFPVIPLIMGVLSAIVATVMSLSMVMMGSIADQAEGDKGGFCFAEGTKVYLKGNKNIIVAKNVSDIKIGDELGYNCGKVTAIIKMNGEGVPLYNIDGIYVSGTHLVKGEDGIWKSVSQDSRAKLTGKISHTLYCFNTTSHTIPIVSNNMNALMVLFRDWEELEDTDLEGQYMWNYTVLKMLNKDKHYDKWSESINIHSETPLIGSKVKIKTKKGYKYISKLSLNEYVLDRKGKEQRILGIIDGIVEESSNQNDTWFTELFELNNGVWIKGKSTVVKGDNTIMGITLITESGEFIILDPLTNKEKIVRDFTDVGHKEIHRTYPMVASRLRLQPSEII